MTKTLVKPVPTGFWWVIFGHKEYLNYSLKIYVLGIIDNKPFPNKEAIMSIFQVNPISLDLAAVRTGLGWAQSWATNPILCKIGNQEMHFIVAEREGFLASWSWHSEGLHQRGFFLIPPFVARTLSGPAAWEADTLEVMIHNNVVGMILRTGDQDFRLQWRWNARDFQAPDEFTVMNTLPDTMINAPYIKVTDIVHLAVANLMSSIPDEQNAWQKDGAILVDFTPGQINIDGEAITREGNQARYYFNPQILMRGLEVVRERQIGFVIRTANRGQLAILDLACQRDGWQVHCALRAVGVSSEMPATNVEIRETRKPMEHGSWFRPRLQDD